MATPNNMSSARFLSPPHNTQRSLWRITMPLAAPAAMPSPPGGPRDDILADPFTPGSFQDLMELLEELDHDSPPGPLAGMAFFVSPAQYLTILQMELPCPGPSDYSCSILYYKSRTSWIHRLRNTPLEY